MVVRYWRDARWVRGTTSQIRRLCFIARTTLSFFTSNYTFNLRFVRVCLRSPPKSAASGRSRTVLRPHSWRYVARADLLPARYPTRVALRCAYRRYVTNPTRRGIVSSCTRRALPTPCLQLPSSSACQPCG